MTTAVIFAGLYLLNSYMPDIVLNILLKFPCLILTVSEVILYPHFKDEETEI